MAVSIFASLTLGPFIQCAPFNYTEPCAQKLAFFFFFFSPLSALVGLTGDVTFS